MKCKDRDHITIIKQFVNNTDPLNKSFRAFVDKHRSEARSAAGERIALHHLVGAACTNFDKRAYEPIDDVDKVSAGRTSASCATRVISR